MLISPRQLIDRLRHPRSRADELAVLRARARAQPGRWRATAAQIESAVRLRRLRLALSEAFGEVASCSGCARGHPLPAGRWDGGHCCGGRTLDIFSAIEVAALQLGGTRVAALEPPAGDHAGCSFRGPRGCSLGAADRPSICVRYVCPELRLELRERPDRDHLAALTRELDDERRRFARLMESAPEEGFASRERPMVRDDAVASSADGELDLRHDGLHARRASATDTRAEPGSDRGRA